MRAPPKVRPKQGTQSCSSSTAGSLGDIVLALESHSMSLSCPPAPLIRNLAGNPMDSKEQGAGNEDGRRLEKRLQATHHRATAAETKEAGRENTSAISRREASAKESTSGGAWCILLKCPSPQFGWFREKDPGREEANRNFSSEEADGATIRLSAPLLLSRLFLFLGICAFSVRM